MLTQASLGCGVLAVLAAAAGGQAPKAPAAGDLVSVRAVADGPRVGPGQTFELALVFDIQPQWHIYWKNPGGGSMPPRVSVSAPPGYAVGALRWPRPSVVEGPLGPEYFYAEQAVIFVPITAPPQLDDGRARIEADVRWAVCRERCILGSARVAAAVETSSLAVAAGGAAADPVVGRYRHRLPRPLADVDGAGVSFDGATLILTVPAGGHREARFLPDDSPGVTYGSPRVTSVDGRFKVSVDVEVRPQNALGEPMHLGGLVALGGNPDDPCYDFEMPLDSGSGRQPSS